LKEAAALPEAEELVAAFLEQLSCAVIAGAQYGVIRYWLLSTEQREEFLGHRVLEALQLLMYGKCGRKKLRSV
jgi:hypothetical protein